MQADKSIEHTYDCTSTKENTINHVTQQMYKHKHIIWHTHIIYGSVENQINQT